MTSKVEQETEALRAVVREAHEAIKDMTRLLREVRTLKTEVEQVAGTVFEERMTEQVQAGLEKYHASISTAIENATGAVDKRFDTLANIMLGEDWESRKEGQPSLTELAKRAKDRARL